MAGAMTSSLPEANNEDEDEEDGTGAASGAAADEPELKAHANIERNGLAIKYGSANIVQRAPQNQNPNHHNSVCLKRRGFPRPISMLMRAILMTLTPPFSFFCNTQKVRAVEELSALSFSMQKILIT